MTHRIARLAALVVALTLPAAFAAAAGAHVTVVPKTAPAGAYTVLDVRVPNERDDAPTTKVELQLPPGFASAAFQPVPGWDVRVVRERLSTPVETENGPISERVERIVWSGGEIPPGAFQDFPISVRIPDRAGETLTFKALQTYAGGEVVRWIGAPDAERPAAGVEIVAAAGEGEGAGAGHGAPSADDGEAASPPAAAAPADDDGASTGLVVAALVAGVAGLLLGGAALALAIRRGRGGSAPAP